MAILINEIALIKFFIGLLAKHIRFKMFDTNGKISDKDSKSDRI